MKERMADYNFSVMTDEQIIQQKITLTMLKALGHSSQLAPLVYFPITVFVAWIFYQQVKHTNAILGWAAICMVLSLFCTFCANLLIKLTVHSNWQRRHLLNAIAGFVFGLYFSLGVAFFFSGMAPLWQCTLLSLVILLVFSAVFTSFYSPWVFFSFVTAVMSPVGAIGYFVVVNPIVRMADMVLFFAVCLLSYLYVKTYIRVKKKIQHTVRTSLEAIDRERLLHVLVQDVLVTMQDVVCQAYQRTSDLFGYVPQQLVGRNIGDLFVDPTVATRLLQKMGLQFEQTKEILQSEQEHGSTVMVCHANGLHRVAQLFCEVSHTWSGRPIFIWNFANITHRKAAEDLLRAREAMYQGLVETAHDLMLYLDTSLQVVYANHRGALRLLGCAAESIIGRSFVDFFDYEMPEEEEGDDPFSQLITKGTVVNGTVKVRQTDGYSKMLAVYLYPIHGAEGHVMGVAGTLSDCAVAQDQEERVLYLATHDELTGLPNRRMIMDRSLQAIRRVQRTKGRLALLLVDLDRFKDINDTFGHKAGDHVLEVLSLRMRAAVRSTDVVARLGGDEYLVLLPEIVGVYDTEVVAQRVAAAVRLPIPFGTHTLQVYASIGISFYPLDGSTVEALMHVADEAMYAAKELGVDRYVFSKRRSAEQIDTALL